MMAQDAEIESLRTTPVDSATLERARTKMRSSLYSIVEEFSGLGKLDLLASFSLFDNDPAKINTLEDGFAAVTPDQIMKTANEWLRKENRTVYVVLPGATDRAAAGTP
jgi:predicted Zn-dependent peptidase